MAKINLLPWRQEYRAQKQKEFQQVAVLVVMAAGFSLFLWMKTVDGQIANQNERNQILQTEINTLNKQVREIKELKKRRQELIDRMRVIQELQGNRPLAVRYFDEMVRAAPEGLWLTSLARKGNAVQIAGVAESNNRVSSFMRNLDQSDWYENPNLTGVTARPEFGEQASAFQMTVNVSGRKKDEEQADAGN
ncbi:PilN domain-containing protein [Microbulbifer thermotolerans]|uniref:PilN domain-containing protein n=1 Tax=Microbulbifer thermotolerans TaxID=252514 RepID=A0A143HIM2_MICTH|nr:PilN domain-containing protein [Microbulbifer thermotolerans]AMX01356.1 pilus assembly protein PilN [Microbulbifer thermotolerans]MCX2780297.1 PilN domain-containing protein [Microbulbifer thermotolerans]MCX2782760.1 PilN domain-containing protein [Microbulbifer thermotolerans]MCX2795515.1 PilN domain-containing protein [Microbulbifer thermotolerans]MCX2800228.1 PilN domain-containing protein [Microbulbifer thermotolerans]